MGSAPLSWSTESTTSAEYTATEPTSKTTYEATVSAAGDEGSGG